MSGRVKRERRKETMKQRERETDRQEERGRYKKLWQKLKDFGTLKTFFACQEKQQNYFHAINQWPELHWFEKTKKTESLFFL